MAKSTDEKNLDLARKDLADRRSTARSQQAERPADFVTVDKESADAFSLADDTSHCKVLPATDRPKGWASSTTEDGIRFRLSVDAVALFSVAFKKVKALEANIINKKALADLKS